jgi:hypothetical protein
MRDAHPAGLLEAIFVGVDLLRERGRAYLRAQ